MGLKRVHREQACLNRENPIRTSLREIPLPTRQAALARKPRLL
jgi:hypothetical protein